MANTTTRLLLSADSGEPILELELNPCYRTIRIVWERTGWDLLPVVNSALQALAAGANWRETVADLRADLEERVGIIEHGS
jgi:hypothetical protein